MPHAPTIGFDGSRTLRIYGGGQQMSANWQILRHRLAPMPALFADRPDGGLAEAGLVMRTPSIRARNHWLTSKLNGVAGSVMAAADFGS
ncbi:hypothetical protein [Nocardia brasiliensis]